MKPKPKITPRLILTFIATPFIILGYMAFLTFCLSIPVMIFKILFGL